MKKPGRTIVIGAGMAGLSAALRLKEAGHDVVVVERDNRPGGRVQTVVRKDGDLVDVGAQFIHSSYLRTLDLTKKFGLESELVEMKTDNMVMRGDKKYTLKWKQIRVGAMGFLSQVTGTIGLGLLMLRRRKDLKNLEGWQDLIDLDDIEVTTYSKLKLNQDTLDYIIRPLVLTYSMSECEGINLAYLLRCLYMYFTTETYCYKSGNDILPKKMAEKLDVRYETEVKQILINDQGKVTGIETSEGTIEGSKIISAIPSTDLLPLYSNWNYDQARFLKKFTFGKLPLVTFEGKVRDDLEYYGGVLDRNVGYKTCFLEIPHKKRDGVSASYCSAWSHHEFTEDVIDLPDKEIIELFKDDLCKILPTAMDSVDGAFVTRFRSQFPQYKIGTFKQLVKFIASEGTPEGLYFAGDYIEGGLIEGAVASGQKAADKIIKGSIAVYH